MSTGQDRDGARRYQWLVPLVIVIAMASAVTVHRLHVEAPSGSGFMNMDLDRQYYPNAVFLHNELRAGNFPTWNPHQAAGQPFAALHQSAVFYPPNVILTWLLAPERALEALFVLHLVIAGGFTWALGLRIGLTAIPALAAAVCYMLSPSQLNGLYMPPFQFTEAWLPAILWAVHGLVVSGGPRWAIGLALTLAMAFLGGHAQGFVYEAQLAVAYGATLLAFLTPRSEWLRRLGWAGVAGLLALGFVAPQLFSALELARAGIRSLDGQSLATASAGAITLQQIVHGMSPWLGSDGQLAWFVRLPLLTPVLASIGWLARGRARRPLLVHWLFFLVVAIACALFLAGRETPVFEWYYALPLGSLFRGPFRIAFVYLFATSLLAAIGVEVLRQWVIGMRVRVGSAPRLAFALSAVVVVVLGIDVYGRARFYVSHPSVSGAHAGAPASLVEFLTGRPGWDRTFVATPNRVRQPPLLHKFGMMNRIGAVPDYDPMMPRAYADYFGVDLSEPWHGDLRVFQQRGKPPPDPHLRLLLDLMSVRHYAALEPLPERRQQRLRRFAGGDEWVLPGARVVERPDALPRVYTVTRIVHQPDLAASLARIRHSTFEPRDEAVVTDADARSGGELLILDESAGERSAGDPSRDRAEILRLETERVEIAASCTTRCLLVMTDLHYPGWVVYVDDEPAEMLRVNGLYRGVILEPGRHDVHFSFESAAIRRGFVLLAVSVLALPGIAALRFG